MSATSSIYADLASSPEPTQVSNQYVWGARPNHRDELVLRDRDDNGDGVLEERLYCLMDYFDPVAVVDREGSVVERYAWSAFGLRTVMAPDWSPREGSEFAWSFGFHGQFLDAETNYYNYGYRYYVPWLGRWINRDPIGEDGGVNLYLFVGNSPENWNDWVGLAFTDEGDIIVPSGSPDFPEGWYGMTPKIWTISWGGATGENAVEISVDPDEEGCRCVEIVGSKTLDITTNSSVIGDLVGVAYTQAGLADIRRHERARILVYRKAYTAFLAPFESPPDCKECGLRRTPANNYKRALEDWLKNKQSEAQAKWAPYVEGEQTAITNEPVWKDGGLITGIQHHDVADPLSPIELECPVP